MNILKYLYTTILILIIAACGNKVKNAGFVNDQASLPSSFNFDSLGVKAMSSFINKKSGTMSTLYANELGLQFATDSLKDHSSGEVFALITWKQQDDDRWFGAKVPGELSTLEVVKTSVLNNDLSISYEKREGKTLALVSDTTHQQDRIKFILAQQPSVMP